MGDLDSKFSFTHLQVLPHDYYLLVVGQGEVVFETIQPASLLVSSDGVSFVQDVSIIGGSVTGFLAARELASRGIDVTIYEEHREIGVPEKCDGLVSSRGMSELGSVPPSNVVQNDLPSAGSFLRR